MKRLIYFAVLVSAVVALVYAENYGDWRSVKQWLEQNYEYPESGPNYDWPDSGRPRIVNGALRTIDGFTIPVPRGTRDPSLAKGYAFSPEYPETEVTYRVDFTSRSDAQRAWQELVSIFSSTFRVNLAELDWEQSGANIVIKGQTDSIRVNLLIPGSARAKQITFPNTADYFIVEFNLRGVEHFYFSKSHLRVVDDAAWLSDGTRVPLFPGRKVQLVEGGMVQGSDQVVVQYQFNTHGLADKLSNIDADFVALYTYYAKEFGFPVTGYRIWDQDTAGFIIAYENNELEIRFAVGGRPVKNGLHTDASGMGYEELEYHVFTVSIYLKGRTHESME